MQNLKDKAIRILKWVERYTKTDMLYLIRGGFWLTSAQFISSGSVFLASLAFANLLQPDTYGTYRYVLSVFSILLISALPGIDSALTRSVARGDEGTLLPGFKEKMKWSLFGSIGAIGLGIYYLTKNNTSLSIAFFLCAVVLPFFDSLDVYNSFLNGKKMFAIFSRWNITKKIITTILLIIPLFFTNNLYLILFFYFIPSITVSAYYLLSTFKKYISNDKIDPEAISYGKHLSVISTLTVILGELDKILVFHYLGATNLAVYTLASAPTDQIKGLFKNVNFLAIPKFSMQDAGNLKRSMKRKIVALSLASCSVITCYILIAPFAFKIFFPKYLSSIPYSQILAISLIGSIGAMLLNSALESQKETRGLYIYNIVTNIFNLAILFPLIYFFGIWGAVGTRVATRFLSFALSYILVSRMPESPTRT